MSCSPERDWRDGLFMKEVHAKPSGAIYWHIRKKDWVEDKNKAHFDYEGPERVDRNSLRGRLTNRGVDIPRDCEAIIIQGGEKILRMLDEPRFSHLSEYILPYPGCPSKKYIWLGLSENRRPNDGAIMDLIYSSFRQSPY